MPTLSTSRAHLLDVVRCFAAPRLGFFTPIDADALGLTRRRLRSWCDSGLIHRIFAGVYHVSLCWEQLDRNQRAVAYLLAAGPGAALTRLAGIEFGGGTRFEAGMIDIIVPTSKRIKLPGARLHVLSDIDAVPIAHPRGYAVTCDSWSLAEAGRDFVTSAGPYQIANAIHALNYRDRTTDLADRIEAQLNRRRHLGSPIVRRALDLHRATSAGTRARTEDRWLEMALAAWHRDPLVNCAHALTASGYEVDFLYERERLRVELDGGHHGRIKDAKNDRDADDWYRANGFLTLHETWKSVWRDLPGCRDRLLAALTRSR